MGDIMTADDKEMLSRWRLILGQFAENNIPLDGDMEETEDALAFLYDREYSAEGRGMRGDDDRTGGRGASVFTVP